MENQRLWKFTETILNLNPVILTVTDQHSGFLEHPLSIGLSKWNPNNLGFLPITAAEKIYVICFMNPSMKTIMETKRVYIVQVMVIIMIILEYQLIRISQYSLNQDYSESICH